jgi:4'-phosphopantetheinyl transferase
MTPGQTSWQYPPLDLKLIQHDIHVWRVNLNEPSTVVDSMLRVLTSDERNRAERFHFERDRDHFIVSRGTLRKLLGHYLHVEPGRVRICYGPFGKPALAQEYKNAGLHFNVSHSRGLALFAFSRGLELGIDLEFVREDFATDDIASKFFAPGEVEKLRTIQPHLRAEAFFTCWTRKEAYIKAVGKGLSLPLDEFEVSFSPDEAPAVLTVKDKMMDAARWSLRDLSPGPGFVAAIASEGCARQLNCWQWHEG